MATAASAPLTASSLNTPSSVAANSSNLNLTNADFLKLLIAQMQNQNPLNPTSSTDMVTQLSQFSTVSGIQQMNTSLNNLMLLQGLTQASNLIGKNVTYMQPGTGNPARGTVSSIQVAGGNVQLMVGTTAVPLTQVTGIA
jgi:flagellar basal-body rod modification protein FlgD